MDLDSASPSPTHTSKYSGRNPHRVEMIEYKELRGVLVGVSGLALRSRSNP